MFVDVTPFTATLERVDTVSTREELPDKELKGNLITVILIMESFHLGGL